MENMEILENLGNLFNILSLYVLIISILFVVSQGVTVYLFFKALKDKKIEDFSQTIDLSKMTLPALAYIITYVLYHLFN